ncbi:glutathione S-transferase [Kordiimonas sp. SCSIO 12610]|uniref:glutathione S-transferase n=1 Tax=Kordiimonas sp. SCSIO 12610 TaxID=2829597 RepID=UPI00210E5F2E|nr:glutathione S-transferase [Kordiimonas sp. SCSIO 12610]UTW55263.1 glutathione S-transferase [Kordiimonas sp. SCSIO 12610]
MTDNAPILYSFRRCPYAMRARLAVVASGQNVKLREVVLRDKPAHMLEISPKGTVPVLMLDDGTVIDESRDIMNWALSQSDPDCWLTPTGTSSEEMNSLVDRCDGDFKYHLDRYKYHTRYENADPMAHRMEAEKFLETLDARLTDRPYLCGSTFSFADAAIAPFIRQFVNASQSWFPSSKYTNVQRWLADFLDSPRFKSIMPKFPQWHEGESEIDFPLSLKV